MLQRSPTYIVPVPSEDRIANTLPKLIGRERAYAVTRQKNVAKQRLIFRFCQQYPGAARRLIRHLNAKQLPAGYPVDEHFRPAYNPWDQRLCAVPDADMFKAIREGRASVVTDQIETFTERGIRLQSGRELEADIIVTATGLNLLAFGGISLSVDGVRRRRGAEGGVQGLPAQRRPQLRLHVRLHQLVVDAEGRAGMRTLLPAAGAHGRSRPDRLLPATARVDGRPGRCWSIAAGYVKRAVDQFPHQGTEGPWRTSMDYRADNKMLREGPVEDDHLRFATVVLAAALEPPFIGPRHCRRPGLVAVGGRPGSEPAFARAGQHALLGVAQFAGQVRQADAGGAKVAIGGVLADLIDQGGESWCLRRRACAATFLDAGGTARRPRRASPPRWAVVGER